jgi:hypothetical protein
MEDQASEMHHVIASLSLDGGDAGVNGYQSAKPVDKNDKQPIAGKEVLYSLYLIIADLLVNC